jgi:hypothetical protein
MDEHDMDMHDADMHDTDEHDMAAMSTRRRGSNWCDRSGMGTGWGCWCQIWQLFRVLFCIISFENIIIIMPNLV